MATDEAITKRLHVSGLTPALTAEDLSKRLSTFGTVTAVDGFGLQDGLGQPRKFGYVTIQTTTGKLARCGCISHIVNDFLPITSSCDGNYLRSKSPQWIYLERREAKDWRGKTRFQRTVRRFCPVGNQQPGNYIYMKYTSSLASERLAAEEPPKKKRKRSGGVEAEDMSLVTPENVEGRGGWKVTPLGRIVRPVRMRPERPLPPINEDKEKKLTARALKKKGADGKGEDKKKKKKRIKEPDVRARRRTIDVTRWGSVHLKGMFLDLEVLGTRRDVDEKKVDDVEMESDESESEGEAEIGKDGEAEEQDYAEVEDSSMEVVAPTPFKPLKKSDIPSKSTISAKSATPVPVSTPPPNLISSKTKLPDDNTDITAEKNTSLNLLASLFGSKDDTDWVGRESVGSDVDEAELTKDQGMLLDGDDDDFEIVPQEGADAAMEEGDGDEGDAMEEDPTVEEVQQPPPTQKQQQAMTLKDLFAPREDDGVYRIDSY